MTSAILFDHAATLLLLINLLLLQCAMPSDFSCSDVLNGLTEPPALGSIERGNL